MDFIKKKLQQEFDDKLETEQQAKRHLERRVRQQVSCHVSFGPHAHRNEKMNSAGWCQTIKQVPVCLCVLCACLQLAEAQTDSEDVQRSVQQLKKKCQKLTAELQDTKLHLEGLQSRNHDLEKKQRKSVSL